MEWGRPGSAAHGILQARLWSELPCPPPGDLPDPGMEPASFKSPALPGRFFTTRATWEAYLTARAGPSLLPPAACCDSALPPAGSGTDDSSLAEGGWPGTQVGREQWRKDKELWVGRALLDPVDRGIKVFWGPSLAVQWLRLHLPMQGMWVSSLIWKLGSHIPQGQKHKTEAIL